MKVFPQPVHAAPGCVYQHKRFLFCTESTEAWAAPRLIYTLRRPVLHPDVSKHWSWATPWRIYTTEACSAPGSVWSIGAWAAPRTCPHDTEVFAAPRSDYALGLSPVPEIIDPVFAKTSPKRSFSMTEYERFGLVFTKTRVYKFGHWTAPGSVYTREKTNTRCVRKQMRRAT